MGICLKSNTICCVFRPANGCSAPCSLVKINPFLSFFCLFLPLVTEKDEKNCFNAETNDFDNQTALVCWSKYTATIVDSKQHLHDHIKMGKLTWCKPEPYLMIPNRFSFKYCQSSLNKNTEPFLFLQIFFIIIPLYDYISVLLFFRYFVCAVNTAQVWLYVASF